MAKYNHSFQKYDPEKMGRAVGRDLGISTKQSIEICSAIRRKRVQAVKKLLQEVIELKKPIAFNRFSNGIGHKRGNLGAGAFPVKAATQILKVVENAEANAKNKGLNENDLTITHVCAQKAATPMHQGRQRRSQFKRSHIEVVVVEKKAKVKNNKNVKVEKQAETKKVEQKQQDNKTDDLKNEKSKVDEKKSKEAESQEDKK